ncbi:hypothetical protein B0A48_01827 [Cryoendolithus antarcticus]|uniref:Uncharacterized protein n=1 Tax=Cryoendolithus antarcticus TaxID=1507870 RepID=A0A1V8TQR4_9PEZI|nr:hypothetical protein B0A48_01827 [Cryoendolithus antarcticus]
MAPTDALSHKQKKQNARGEQSISHVERSSTVHKPKITAFHTIANRLHDLELLAKIRVEAVIVPHVSDLVAPATVAALVASLPAGVGVVLEAPTTKLAPRVESDSIQASTTPASALSVASPLPAALPPVTPVLAFRLRPCFESDSTLEDVFSNLVSEIFSLPTAPPSPHLSAATLQWPEIVDEGIVGPLLPVRSTYRCLDSEIREVATGLNDDPSEDGEGCDGAVWEGKVVSEGAGDEEEEGSEWEAEAWGL